MELNVKLIVKKRNENLLRTLDNSSLYGIGEEEEKKHVKMGKTQNLNIFIPF